MKARSLRNIKRDDGRVPGWLVVFVRSETSYSKRFTDSTHGGRTGAFKKAQSFRDRLLKTLPVLSFIQKRRQRSKKRGIVGVHEKRSRKGRVTHFVATWPEDGRRARASFSVNDHGYHAARRLAIRTRREAVARILAPRGPLPTKRERTNPFPGVHYTEAMLPSGNLYTAYSATWYDASGRGRQRTFSIKKYGDGKALALARQARQRAIQEKLAAMRVADKSDRPVRADQVAAGGGKRRARRVSDESAARRRQVALR